MSPAREPPLQFCTPFTMVSCGLNIILFNSISSDGQARLLGQKGTEDSIKTVRESCLKNIHPKLEKLASTHGHHLLVLILSKSVGTS